MHTPQGFYPGFHMRPGQLSPLLGTPLNFQCPRWLDNRPYMLPSDDQGNTSMCAAFAIAGLIEAHTWRKSNVPQPVDAPRIYAEAKAQFDQSSVQGTTFDAVFKSAVALNLLSGRAALIWINRVADLPFALHKHGVLLAAFNCTAGWMHPTVDGWIAPDPDILGGHAVAACWFDKSVGIGFQNSWSDRWGVRGFGRMTWAQAETQFLQACAIVWDNE